MMEETEFGRFHSGQRRFGVSFGEGGGSISGVSYQVPGTTLNLDVALLLKK